LLNLINQCMRTTLVLFFLIVANQAFSQKNIFATLKIDATTKIIGRSSEYDKNKTYEKYNFIIENPAQIENFIKNLKLGDEVPNSMEDPNFTLAIVKNRKEIGSWTVNPTLKSVMTNDGHTYKFDLNQISELNSKYPFNYYYEAKVFKSKHEYESYLSGQKNNPGFLFDYAPLFRYEGSFEIEFKKSAQFPNPKAIMDYLEPYIEKIVSKEKYNVVYILDDKNMKDRDQYTMTISGSEKLYEELKVENLKNENWTPTVEDASFFYKK
jgi:hypothetical protein